MQYKTVTLGNFTLKNAEEKSPVEWLVLTEKDGKKLLLSRDTLDVRPYHESTQDISWIDCTLRDWLNEEFLKAAFSADEQTEIAETNGDKVFLLSREEVLQYLPESSDRICSASGYAVARGAMDDLSQWWLRDQGSTPERAMVVTEAGFPACGGPIQERAASVFADGLFVGVNYCAVRPALWVKEK